MALLMSVLCSALRADVVLLRNGLELSGMVSEKGDKYEIKLDVGGTASVSKVDVKEVRATQEDRKVEVSVVDKDLLIRLEKREKAYGLIEALRSTSPPANGADELAKLGDDGMPAISAALEIPDERFKLTAVDVLRRVGSARAHELLLELLDAKESAVRIAAADALAAFEGKESDTKLLYRFMTEKDMSVKVALVPLLGKLKSELSVPILLKGTDDPEPRIRSACIAALRTIAAPATAHMILAKPLRVEEEPIFAACVSRSMVARLFELAAKGEPRQKRLCQEGIAVLQKSAPDAVARIMANSKDADERRRGLEILLREDPVAAGTILFGSKDPEEKRRGLDILAKVDPVYVGWQLVNSSDATEKTRGAEILKKKFGRKSPMDLKPKPAAPPPQPPHRGAKGPKVPVLPPVPMDQGRKEYVLSTDPRRWEPLVSPYFLPQVQLVTVGTVNRKVVDDVRQKLLSSFKLLAKDKVISLPTEAFNKETKRYRAEVILKKLDQMKRPNSPLVVGLTSVELETQGYPFAYSPTDYDRSILISITLLDPQRVWKGFLHALRQSLGLPECGDEKCPGRVIYWAEDYDRVKEVLCANCQTAVSAALGSLLAKAGDDYAGAAKAIATLMEKQAVAEKLAVRTALLYEAAGDFEAAHTIWTKVADATADPELKEILKVRQPILQRYVPPKKEENK